MKCKICMLNDIEEYGNAGQMEGICHICFERMNKGEDNEI